MTLEKSLIPIGCLMIVVALAVFGLDAFQRSRESRYKDWPTTPGKIVSTEVIKTNKTFLHFDRIDRSMPPDATYDTAPVWAIEVKCDYKVNGQAYDTCRPTSTLYLQKIEGDDPGPDREIRDTADKLPKGTRVDVHYNPDNPVESYILYTEGSSTFRTFSFACGGAGMLLLALGIFARSTGAGSR